jgi:hypothetical protein
MPELDFESAIKTNWIRLGTLEMEATGDRIIVVQDEFRSGMECIVCKGKDIRSLEGGEAGRTVSVVECDGCKGKGTITREGVRADEIHVLKCSQCGGKGWTPCPACEGKGGIIVFAQQDEKRPTTGTIVSVGWKLNPKNWYARLRRWLVGATMYRRGESVIYPSFAGHFWELEAVDENGEDVRVTIGVLREDEIITRVRGHLELRRVKKSVALHTAA